MHTNWTVETASNPTPRTKARVFNAITLATYAALFLLLARVAVCAAPRPGVVHPDRPAHPVVATFDAGDIA